MQPVRWMPTHAPRMPHSRAVGAGQAALLLLLAHCPSAAGGAGRGRPEAACADVDNCDWVATWGCSNDDGTDGFRCCCVLRPARVAEGRLFEYNLRRADCLAGRFPPLPTNATTSLGALRPAAPGASSCQDGVGAGAAPRNGSALVSASTAAAALATVRAASALSIELWLRPSAADLASPGQGQG